MNVNENLGKRCLMKESADGWSSTERVEEFEILEVSPSGQWAKVMNMHGNKFWKPCSEIAIVEILKQLEPAPKENFYYRLG